MKKAQTADRDIDVSTDMQGYKQAVESLSASISACVGPDLLSKTADIVVTARELEWKMKAKLEGHIAIVKQTLQTAISTAENTREWGPLAAYLKTLVVDEVLKQSCGDAVESAQKLLVALQAEEKARIAEVSVDMRLCFMQ